ncbi:MAG: carboxypeptidase-like regulatory domain-containing protein [Saprospiraceae bacterium]
MKKFYAIPWVICFLFFQNITIHSQTSITGKVTDKDSGEDMIAANVVVTKNGNFIQGETTDIDGNYSMRFDPGTYDVRVSYTGYVDHLVRGVIANAGQATKVDVEIGVSGDKLEDLMTLEYRVPLSEEPSPGGYHGTKYQIRNLPTRNINAVAAATAGAPNSMISGKVTDKNTGEEMIAANIMVSKNGNLIQGVTSDIDGDYSIGVDAGTYDLEFSYTGYPTKKIKDVVVEEAEIKVVDAKLEIGRMMITYCPILIGYKIPLIKQDEISTGITISSDKIRNLPTRNINEIPSMTPGVSFSQ